LATSDTVQGYYNTILNRPGSAAEIDGWVALVDGGGAPLSQVETALINSYEAASTVSPIVEMYQAALGRVPDAEGLTYWVTVAENGSLNLSQIGLAIASSAESQGYYGTAFDAAFVTSLYQRILDREPEPGVVDYWLAARDAGMTQADMIVTFAVSSEAQARAAPAVNKFLASAAEGDPDAYSGSLFAAGQTEPPPPGPAVFSLTTGADTGASFIGTSANDTFNAIEDTSGISPIPTWTTNDVIDGGGGTNTFNVTQTAPIDGTPLNATVTNIQIANVVDASTVTLDTTEWTGLAALNVTDVGTTALTAAGSTAVTLTDTELGIHSVNVNGGSSVAVIVSGETNGGSTIDIGDTTSPTGAVTVTSSSSPTASHTDLATIRVVGGSSVNVTQNVLGLPGSTSTAGSVTVTGTAATTEVSVTATAPATAAFGVTGVNDNAVSITDVNAGSLTAAGTITSVTGNNYTTLSIADTALTTLNLAGGSGNIIIDNSGLSTPTNLTLHATMNGLTGGTLDDADIYTTLNVTTAGRNSTLANITQAALTTLTVAGTKALTLTSTAGMSALSTVTVSGSAGLTADLSNPTVTAIDTSATTGASTVRMDATHATFAGGDGADKVTVAGAVSKAITLGDGDDSLTIGSNVPTVAVSGGDGTDTLSMAATPAATASTNGTFAGLVTGFEKLTLTGATNQTIDLAVLGIANAVTTSGGNGMTLSNMDSGGTLTLNGAGTAYTVANAAFVGPVDDTLNLALTDGSTAGVVFASTGITALGVETIAITTADTQTTPTGTFSDRITLLGNSSHTITVGGNAGLALTATSTGLTTVDASGITLGDFTWTSGALAGAATVKGSVSGTNSVDFSAATGGAVSYTGGSGDDLVTATNGKNNIINLAGGNNTATLTGGDDTVTGGSDGNVVNAGGGNNTITVGNGTNEVFVTGGDNTITVGTGENAITVGSGANTITVGTHGSGVTDSVGVAATGTGTFVPTAIIAGLNTAGSDTITFAGDASANAFTTFTADDMVDFGNALGNNVTAGFAPPTLAAAVADVLGNLGGNLAQHAIGAFPYGGNTYLVEQAGAVGSGFTSGDTLIELTGLNTFNTTNVTSGGVLHLLT
jgi:S-layer protein